MRTLFYLFPLILLHIPAKNAHNAIANLFFCRYNEDIMDKYELRSF